MNPRCFNVEIWLKMKVEPTFVYRRCFSFDKTTLKQRGNNYVDSMLITQCCFNILTFQHSKLSQRMFIGLEKITLKKFCQYLLY